MAHTIALNTLERSVTKSAEDTIITARPVLVAVLTGIGYFLGARLGFALTFHDHPVSTLWPPNSILMAVLLLTPYRWWWFILLAVFPAHLLIELNSGVPITMVLCWFVSNSCEALIGASIVRRFTEGKVRFDSVGRVVPFFAAAVIAPFLSSFLDAAFVVLNGFGSRGYWQVWRLRLLSNVLAELTLVPFIVIWVREGVATWRGASLLRWLEATFLVISLIIVGVAVFSWLPGSLTPSPAMLYAPLPVLLWATVRFGTQGLNTSLAAVALLSTWSAVHGRGPFIAQATEENALGIQLFLIVITIPLMFLSAVLMELNRSQTAARQNADQLHLALGAAQMGLWDWHIADDLTSWSDETKRMFGFRPVDPELGVAEFYSLIHPDDREIVQKAIERSLEKQVPYEAEFRFTQPDGTYRWIRGKGMVLSDSSGRAMRMVGINADITKRKEAEARLVQSNLQVRALAGRLIGAQEDERRRISRQLHDDLSQKLATLSVVISRLKRKPPAEAEMTVQLTKLYDQTQDLGNDIRQLSHDLHPATLEHLGLADALASHITEFQNNEEIPTTFTCRLPSEGISLEVSVCLYRVTLEALRNIAKHARATSVAVRLTENDEFVTLDVIDAGQGFDVETARRGSGLGLMSAAERVNLLEGSFEIKSTPGEGTWLTARVPLK
jgi:PAS domain S-box-containing protein